MPAKTKSSGKSEEISLIVEINAELVNSNFPEYVQNLKENIASLNYELKTTEDFDTAKTNVAALQMSEDALKAKKAEILKQAEDVSALFDQFDEISDECRKARLSLNNQIKDQKTARKKEIIENAIETVTLRDKSLLKEAFEISVKGMSNFENMEEKLKGIVTDYNTTAEANRELLDKFIADHGKSLITDYADLEQEDTPTVQKELENRLALFQAEENARKAKEEAAKVKAEAEKAEKERLEKQAKETDPEIRQPIPRANTRSGNHLDPRPPLPEAKQPEPDTEPDTEPPLNQTATPPAQETAKQEMERFIKTFITSVAPMAPIRASLVHPENITMAQEFANDFSATIQKLQKRNTNQ